MKALRKGVLVVVQLVVTISLLLQQYPVLAFAASEQIQADNEAAESAADQGNEAVAQKAGSAEVPVNDDSASSAQTIASAEPSSVPKPSNPGVWKSIGSCLWMIDESGLMTIKPQGDGAGCIDSTEYRCPWNEDKDSIGAKTRLYGVQLSTVLFISLVIFPVALRLHIRVTNPSSLALGTKLERANGW